MNYAITVAPLSEEDGGGWIALVPDLPGCVGDGETAEAAFEDACAAMKEWMSEAHRLGREIPSPTFADASNVIQDAHRAA